MNAKPIYIDSRTRAFRLNISDIISYADLIGLFVRKFYVLKYKQTILGPLWLVLSPLLTILINSFIFGTVAQLTPDGIPQLLFYSCGNTVWSIFAGNVSSNASIFLANNHLFSKVYFPRIIVPLSNLLINFFNFLIQLALLIALIVVFELHGDFDFVATPQLFLLPVIILQMSCLGLGAGLLFSAMTTKYRDISFVVGLIIQVCSYASPIVYSIADIPENLTKWYFLNPITPSVCYFKYIFLQVDYIEPRYLLLGICLSCLVLIAGTVIFNIAEKNSVDTI